MYTSSITTSVLVPVKKLRSQSSELFSLEGLGQDVSNHVPSWHVRQLDLTGINSVLDEEVSDVDMSGTHCVSISEKPEFPPYNLRLKNVSNPLPFFFSFLGRFLGFGTFFGHELNIK